MAEAPVSIKFLYQSEDCDIGASSRPEKSDVAGATRLPTHAVLSGSERRSTDLNFLSRWAGLLVCSHFHRRGRRHALGGDRYMWFCLPAALVFHLGADQEIQFQKNIAMAGGFPTLALLGLGAWSLDGCRVRSV
jgi:hypothetical protein